MPLSLSKLENLMSANGFIPITFFTMNNICVYVETMSISTTEIFLLYIPSKYEFITDKHSSVSKYEIKYFDTDDKDNIPENYAGEQRETIENIYKEININSSNKSNDIGNQLEDNYNKKISLKDSLENNVKRVRDNARQLKRLKLCVQNIKYKIAIQYKNYLCVIKRDNDIGCYTIKKYNNKNQEQLYIIVDLETFYEKLNSLVSDISTVKQGIYDILNKNHSTHVQTFQTFLEKNKNAISLSNSCFTKILKYEKNLKELYEMLNTIIKREKVALQNVYNINTRYNNSLKNLSNDIERAHLTSKYNNELEDIQKIKEDIIKIIFEVKAEYENILLNLDKAMFDNNVMIECMIKNFSELNFCN